MDENKFAELGKELESSGLKRSIDELKRLFNNRMRIVKNEEMAWNQLVNDVKKSIFTGVGQDYEGVVFGDNMPMDNEERRRVNRKFLEDKMIKEGASEDEIKKALLDKKYIDEQGNSLNRFHKLLREGEKGFTRKVWGVTNVDGKVKKFVDQVAGEDATIQRNIAINFKGSLDKRANQMGDVLYLNSNKGRFIPNGNVELNKLLVADKEKLVCSFIESIYSKDMITLDKINEWLQNVKDQYNDIFVSKVEITSFEPELTQYNSKQMFVKDLENKVEPILCYVNPMLDGYAPGSIVYIFAGAKMKDSLVVNVHGMFPIDAAKINTQEISEEEAASRFV